MQQLTVQVPDNKMAFFLELVHNLGFIAGNNKQKEVLTAQQIEEVNAERQKIKDNPDYLLDWDEARKTLKLD